MYKHLKLKVKIFSSTNQEKEEKNQKNSLSPLQQ